MCDQSIALHKIVGCTPYLYWQAVGKGASAQVCEGPPATAATGKLVVKTRAAFEREADRQEARDDVGVGRRMCFP